MENEYHFVFIIKNKYMKK